MHGYTIKYEPKAEKQFLALDDDMQRQIMEHAEWYVANFICRKAKRKGFRALTPVGFGPRWTTYSGPYRMVLHSDSGQKVVSIMELELADGWLNDGR